MSKLEKKNESDNTKKYNEWRYRDLDRRLTDKKNGYSDEEIEARSKSRQRELRIPDPDKKTPQTNKSAKKRYKPVASEPKDYTEKRFQDEDPYDDMEDPSRPNRWYYKRLRQLS